MHDIEQHYNTSSLEIISNHILRWACKHKHLLIMSSIGCHASYFPMNGNLQGVAGPPSNEQVAKSTSPLSEEQNKEISLEPSACTQFNCTGPAR